MTVTFSTDAAASFIISFEQLIFRFVGSPDLSCIGTQALVPPSSNHSSEDSTSPSDRPVIARARALVDYTPSPYDKDVLKFKVGLVVVYSKLEIRTSLKAKIYSKYLRFFLYQGLLKVYFLRFGKT